MLSPREILDIVLMSLIVGFIFQDFFRRPVRSPDEFLKNVTKGRWRNLLKSDYAWAVALVAPSIILHEFGHKFVAQAFGAEATFHAAYTWLGIALILKFALGFVFFVPAYVSITGLQTNFQGFLVSFAGPGINLLLWLLPLAVLRYWPKRLDREVATYLGVFAKINMFLFIFNMLPIPGFDGLKVYTSLFAML